MKKEAEDTLQFGGATVGTKVQTEAGKKKEGDDMRKGNTKEDGGESDHGNTGGADPDHDLGSQEGGDQAEGEEAVLGTSKTQEPRQDETETKFIPVRDI